MSDEPDEGAESVGESGGSPAPSDDEGSGSVAEVQSQDSSLDSSAKSAFDSDAENAEGPVFDGEEEEDVDPEFKKKFNAAKAEYIQNRNQSILIQQKVLALFPNLGFEDSSSSVAVSEFPHRYQDALDRLEVQRSQLIQTKTHYESELKTMQAHCAEADHRRIEKEDVFRKLREECGRTSVVSRTNKPIKAADLNSKENQLSSKDFELEQTRIDYIRTKNKFKQTEDELNKQDQLSEGLHLIDFEQLKIENQTLNEKKAEKNQDLVKIEDKIKVNAHMLTHVKEKLAFVRKQKLARMQSQQEMEDRYGQSRGKLASVRIHRDKVRDENSTLKKSSGLIGMTDLLYDFENRSNEFEAMQERVTELKTKFNDLMALQRELEAKIAQRQPMDPSLLKMNR
jgi:hypothetical protein